MLQVSQTGELGESLRSEERAYYNYPELVVPSTADDFLAQKERFFDDPKYTRQDVTRRVLRVVLNNEVSQEVFGDPEITKDIEAAAPITSGVSTGGSPDHVVYFAQNVQWRRTRNRIEEKTIAKQASPAVRLSRQADVDSDGVVNLTELPEGFRYTSNPDEIRSLTELWSDTFGWNAEGCDRFQQQIEAQREIDPADRRVWFQGIQQIAGGRLVAAAMAERLDMPSSGGGVALIEHSEWSALRNLRGQGFGKLTVHALTQRLKDDLKETEKLIFAECNLTSGAHIVAVRSGLKVPHVETPQGPVGQILKAHVRVGDGFDPVGDYRNFMFVVAE